MEICQGHCNGGRYYHPNVTKTLQEDTVTNQVVVFAVFVLCKPIR